MYCYAKIFGSLLSEEEAKIPRSVPQYIVPKFRNHLLSARKASQQAVF